MSWQHAYELYGPAGVGASDRRSVLLTLQTSLRNREQCRESIFVELCTDVAESYCFTTRLPEYLVRSSHDCRCSVSMR